MGKLLKETKAKILMMLSGHLLNFTEMNIESISSLDIPPGNQKKTKESFFWTRAQFNLLKDVTKWRVLLSSDFGTGKTLLLVSKAKGLLCKKDKKWDGKKEVFVVCFGAKELSRKSLLTLLLEVEFEHLKKAEVLHFKASGKRGKI